MDTWLYNNIQIIVEELPDSGKQIISRLQPLQGHTVHQVFGYESEIYKLTGYVVGMTDAESLRATRRSGLAYTLSGVGFWGDLGDFYNSSLTITPMNNIYQTLRTDLAKNSPVFKVDLELYKNES